MDTVSTPPSTDATWWRHSSLLDRRSVVGAVAIAAVVALFVFVVPLIDDSLEQSRGFDEAGRFIVDDYAAMELADAWEVESRTQFLTTLTNGPYAIIVVSAYVGDTAPADSLKDRRDLFAAEAANTVTEIETFRRTPVVRWQAFERSLPMNPPVSVRPSSQCPTTVGSWRPWRPGRPTSTTRSTRKSRGC